MDLLSRSIAGNVACEYSHRHLNTTSSYDVSGEVTTLTWCPASDPSMAARRRKPGQDASHFKTDKSGKLVIDEPSSSAQDSGPTEMERMAGDAFLANQTSTDGATRDAKGTLKFNKNTKRSRETEREYEMTFGAGIIDQDDKLKKKKKEVTKLGEEFRSKVGLWIISHHVVFASST